MYALKCFSSLVILFFVLCANYNAFAQNATPADQVYVWNDGRMDVGYFYHYVFSDMNGKQPINNFYYMTETGKYQVLVNFYEGKELRGISLSTFTMNKALFCNDSTKDVNLLPANDQSYVSYEVVSDYKIMKETGKYIGIEKGKEKPQTINENVIPNTYRASSAGGEFIIYFRFVKDDVKPFVIVYQDTLRRNYNMDVKYEKDEVVDGIPCRKYLISGQGILAQLGNINGAAWMAKDDSSRYLVKHTMNLRMN